MRRLSGIDSLFVSLESPTNLFQVGAVAVLDPATAPPGSPPPHEGLRQVVAGRLERLAPLRRRLAPSPGGLDHPRWVEAAPDLGRHIRRGALPAPGSERELAAYAAEVLARPLDRRRPLWEIHVVEGLEGGLVAGVAKLHHSIVDGIGGTELTAELMDLSPVAPEDPEIEPWRAEAAPRPARLLADALRDAAGRIPLAGRLGLRLALSAITLRERNRQLDVLPPPAPFSGPRSPLAARVGPDRSVGLAQVDRSEVEEVRRATGATVNDVILYLVGTALRCHLAERGELPPRPLVAFVPKSVRAEDDTLETGVNRLSGMLVSLGTDLADPLLRLMTVAEGASVAKDQERVLGEDLFGELAELVPPALLAGAGRIVRALGLTTRWPPFSVVVSSFPGSPVPLYCAGAELLAYHPFGPVVDGAALNVTATSYRDRIGFGLLACGDAVPQVQMEALSRRIGEAMTQLAKAVASVGRPRRPGRARRAPAPAGPPGGPSAPAPSGPPQPA
jgi:diacylglycerol O-acyltransferase